MSAQQRTLATIHSHLTEAGRLICTLHNPEIRRKTIDGQVRLRGKFQLPNDEGTLFLSTWENFDSSQRLVTGAQFYEVYNRDGILQSKRFVPIQFCLHSKEGFESLANSQGFKAMKLYGDYGRAEFRPEASPFMIWILGKR